MTDRDSVFILDIVGELRDSHPDDLAYTPAKHVALLESMADDELSDLAASGDSTAHRIYGERLKARETVD